MYNLIYISRIGRQRYKNNSKRSKKSVIATRYPFKINVLEKFVSGILQGRETPRQSGNFTLMIDIN